MDFEELYERFMELKSIEKFNLEEMKNFLDVGWHTVREIYQQEDIKNKSNRRRVEIKLLEWREKRDRTK